MSEEVPRVRVECGPGRFDFKLFVNGVELKKCVQSAEYRIAYDEEPTVTVCLVDAALSGEGRLRLPVEQLRALAAEEGLELREASAHTLSGFPGGAIKTGVA